MAPTTDLFQSAFAAFRQGQFEPAERALRKLLRREPKHLGALNVLAIVLVSLKRHAEAEPFLKAALRLDARSDVTFYNYGLVLKALHRPEEALQRLTEALALNPANAETLNSRGTVLNELSDYAAALADFDRALAIDPRYGAAHFNRSKSLVELKRHDEALAACDAALALQPDMAEAWFGRGFIFARLRRPADAVTAYRRALQMAPDLPRLKGNLLHQAMLICDWSDVSRLANDIEADLRAGKLAAEPFGWQGIATSEASLQRCSDLTSAAEYGRTFPAATAKSSATAGGRIRVGYLSGEFREQATALLLVGVLERHDKDAFEIVAIDNGFDDGSATRRRVIDAVDRIIDISAMSDPQAAAAIRAQGIDILVNLNGYFGGHRNGVFARRAAPIQVNYLGFPGTIGSFMDYIIADAEVIPAEHRRFYNEKVAWLPHCYQATDDRRQIAPRAFTRGELGLPSHGFVFCCFNNAYKITPGTFDSWMRIMSGVDGSVLWLLDDHEAAVANLRREAERRGIDPARLVFAPRLLPAEHLARHRCADLFLDTLPYNAHTTASDALWAGLPLLTCRGDTFAGRVAASLLHALDLPELVARDREQFESRAVELALSPCALGDIRAKLAAHRGTKPLFDTAQLTAHIEDAFRMMHRRQQAGLAPQHLAVAP